MRIKIGEQDVEMPGLPLFLAGSQHEVTDEIGNTLVERGQAEAATAPKPAGKPKPGAGKS